MTQYKAAIIGSGNWGSAIARIVGETVKKHNDTFDRTVKMWVFEEEVNGRKLSEIINTDHENVKYLPGHKLPENIVAEPDLVRATCDADVLVFVVPHQFVEGICKQIYGKVKLNSIGISLIKGITVKEGGGIELISSVIGRMLHIRTAVLMGANLAHEVAAENFCEATIGCEESPMKPVLKKLFHTDNFRISVVDDAATVELCGALKNIVACAAGFVDGLGMGDNTKSAVIRLGLMEMTKYVERFYPGSNLETFFESCGIADLITTCYGGRNRKCSEAFVRQTGKSMKDLEVELLGGQRLQGPHTAELVFETLAAANLLDHFPLFVAVHRICTQQIPPQDLIGLLRHHPEHISEAEARKILRSTSPKPAQRQVCTCGAVENNKVEASKL